MDDRFSGTSTRRHSDGRTIMLMYNVGYCRLISAESGTVLGTNDKLFYVSPLAFLDLWVQTALLAFPFVSLRRPMFSLRHNMRARNLDP